MFEHSLRIQVRLRFRRRSGFQLCSRERFAGLEAGHATLFFRRPCSFAVLFQLRSCISLSFLLAVQFPRYSLSYLRTQALMLAINS